MIRGIGFAIHFCDQNVRRLQIAMNDRFLVCVLDSFAHLEKQSQALPNPQLLAIAVVGDGKTIHILHHEVRLARRRCACVEDLRDGGMIHDGERLPLGLEIAE